MEVSFLASGAVNRTHFSLAQKVESASDPGVADEAIIHEIDAIRAKFDKPTFGPISSACRDWLLILLYCETSLTFELPRSDYLHFALPYAVQLAEGGKTLQNRYVGYLFCSMIMPQNHELQLMLVNTCRKDIESPEAARICLALDFLIRCPTSYVIPAISNRLEDLLSHDSQHVRRRVLSAFRILSAYDREILKRTTRKLRKRMKEEGASGTAFLLAMELVRNGLLPNQSAITIVMDVLKRYLSTSGVNASPGIVKAVSVLGRLVTQEQDADILSSAFDMILKLMKRSTDRKHPSHVLMIECFRTLSYLPLGYLQEQFTIPSITHPVTYIKPLLHSKDPNMQYLFLVCITTLDVSLWAGTGERVLSQLRESEVGQVMSFLESNDPTIRILTTRLLVKIDPAIIEAYLSQYISTIPSPLHHALAVCENYAIRALEISGLVDDEGASYANRMTEILNVIQTPRIGNGKDSIDSVHASPKDPVQEEAAKATGWGAGVKAILEGAVEMVLDRLRVAPQMFQVSFVNALCNNVILSEESTSCPTVILIAAATVCEYGENIGVPREKILVAFARSLRTASPALREAILISMLRLAAGDDALPQEVIEAVKYLRKGSGRHIRLRTDQFLYLSSDLTVWKKALSDAKSFSLPDVLAIVESQYALRPQQPADTLFPRSQSRSETPNSPSFQPLRYDAYEDPTSLRESRPSGSRPTSERSEAGWTSPSPNKRGRLVHSSQVDRKAPSVDDLMAQTIVPGAFREQSSTQRIGIGHDVSSSAPSGGTKLPKSDNQMTSPQADILTHRMDLISLESPFHAEPPGVLEEHQNISSAAIAPVASYHQKFASSWSALNKTSRGWCGSSPEKVAKILNGLEIGLVTDFSEESADEILAMASISSDLAHVVIKLRPGEEGSCLWIMKCDDADMAQRVKDALFAETDT